MLFDATPRLAHRTGKPVGRSPRAFSLLELVVVLAVSVVLAGMLLPVLSHVHGNVNRVVSGSNLRQIGLAVAMYDRDFDAIPYSYELDVNERPQELMVVHMDEPSAWDGLGLLYRNRYCSARSVFYCPSHMGEHRLEQYDLDWDFPDGKRIYGNYHYAGHLDWDTRKRRSLVDGAELVLASDAIRSRQELNHESGLNVLRGDGSVQWHEDATSVVHDLPLSATASMNPEMFRMIWKSIEDL